MTVKSVLAVLASVSALGAVVVPTAASDGSEVWRDHGCSGSDAWMSCWEAKTVSHVTLTPSGNWMYSWHDVYDWTYSVSGVPYGTTHGTAMIVEKDYAGGTLRHEVSKVTLRLGDLSCRTMLNIQIVDGQVHHSVDLGPCVLE